MGYLTTITFRNDAAHEIQAQSERVMELIAEAQHGSGPVSLSLKHNNLLIAQSPRHADDTGLYLHWGNTVTDLSSIYGSNERVLNAAIGEMEWRLRQLKSIKKKK